MLNPIRIATAKVSSACEVIPIVVAASVARPPILVPSCGSLDAVAITPSGRKLYVADYSFNRVSPSIQPAGQSISPSRWNLTQKLSR